MVWRIEPVPAEVQAEAERFGKPVLVARERERLETGVFAHADKEWIEACDRNPFEVLDDLVIYGPRQRAMRRMGAGNDQERVAVRIAARDRLRSEAAGNPGLWLDHDRLPEPFRHLVAEKAGDDVHVPSRREAVHEFDRADRIILRRGDAGQRNQNDKRTKGYPVHRICPIASAFPDPGYPSRLVRRPIAAAAQHATAGASGLDRDA